MSDEIDIEALFKMAAKGTLPKDFTDWGKCDGGGWTVAHEAAAYSNLPKGFHKDYPDVWKMKDTYGWPVSSVGIERDYIVD